MAGSLSKPGRADALPMNAPKPSCWAWAGCSGEERKDFGQDVSKSYITMLFCSLLGDGENRGRRDAYILAESPSAHMSVLVVARIAGLVVDETLEGRRAAAGSVFHSCI